MDNKEPAKKGPEELKETANAKSWVRRDLILSEENIVWYQQQIVKVEVKLKFLKNLKAGHP